MESYSLFQLNEYIRRVIALNFREPLWIEAEIAQIKESRGNFYLELIEKEDGGEEVIAQISAAIWYRNFQFIKKKLGDLVNDLLADGTQVRLKCKIDYHERYGIKLVIEDIDPNYTFGKLELKRQEIINRLEEEGLMELNKGEIIPSVIQKIAVISSSGAAGYQDFMNQLSNNNYGYTFDVDLYDSAVQGAKVEKDTCEAIASILKKRKKYHLITIIRGGGSKLDLSGYDNYNIAKSIALSEVPFVIGIGHDIDSTVTDLVACLSLKTPTAVADYILDQNMSFEARLEQSIQNFFRSVTNTIGHNNLQLSGISERLSISSLHLISNQFKALDVTQNELKNTLNTRLADANFALERISMTLNARDPKHILLQGYAYLKKEGNSVKSIKNLKKDDIIEVQLHDGSVNSKVL